MPNIYVKSLKPKTKRTVLFYIVTALLLSALSIYQSANTYGQASYDTAKENYSVQLKKFNLAKTDYLTKKANYAAFQTATAKQAAFDSTKSYLTESNFLLADKLRIIKEFGNTVSWDNSNYDKDDITTSLDEELNYLQTHWADVQKTTSLEQLTSLAIDLDNRLESSLLPKADKSVGTYEVVKIENSFKNLRDLSREIKNYINPRQNEQNRIVISNWGSELDKIERNIISAIDKTKRELDKIPLTSRSNRLDNVFRESKNAKDEFNRSLSLFNEILEVI